MLCENLKIKKKKRENVNVIYSVFSMIKAVVHAVRR